MSEEHVPPPLEEDLAKLLATARTIDAPSDAKARVRSRVTRTIGGPGPSGGGGATNEPTASPAATAPSVAKVPWWMAAAALVAGGAIGFSLRPAPQERVVYVDRPVPAAAPAPATSQAPTLDAVPVESLAAAPSPSAPKPPAGASLAAERALLDVARTALGRHDCESAMKAVGEHEKKFASGALAEEREAIAVQALVLCDRTEAAKQRAAKFRAKYPGSLLLPAVEAAVAAP